jgi:hypothetical protein
LTLWRCLLLALAAVSVACGQKPPSWDVLLSGKITGQYPDYSVTVIAPGQLSVLRPGMPTQMVSVEPIAQHCLRGPRDCGDAVEKILLLLRDP